MSFAPLTDRWPRSATTAPGEVTYVGAAEVLTDVWVAVRASLRAVLEKVTLADLAAGKLPLSVKRLTEDPDTWEPH